MKEGARMRKCGNRKEIHRLLLLGLFLIGSAAVVDHPHFGKTVTASLPGPVELSVRYSTVPAQEMDTEGAPLGKFLNPRAPILQVSETVRLGSTEIPSGNYTIGLIKNGSDDWTLALHPGRLRQKEVAVTPNIILLNTLSSRSSGRSDHLVIDFNPGTGRFEGKVVLTLHWGTLFLAAEISR